MKNNNTVKNIVSEKSKQDEQLLTEAFLKDFSDFQNTSREKYGIIIGAMLDFNQFYLRPYLSPVKVQKKSEEVIKPSKKNESK